MGIFSTFADMGYINIFLIPALVIVVGMLFWGAYVYISQDGGRGVVR